MWLRKRSRSPFSNGCDSIKSPGSDVAKAPPAKELESESMMSMVIRDPWS